MSAKNYGKLCMHCGHDYAIHHYETMQCPKGGEAPMERKQEYLKTTYVPEIPEPLEAVIDSRPDRKERRRQYATAAMHALVLEGKLDRLLEVPGYAFDIADAMLAAEEA